MRSRAPSSRTSRSCCSRHSIGWWSERLFDTTGQLNAFFGEGTGSANTIGTGNTFIGRDADFDANGAIGDNNTLLGLTSWDDIAISPNAILGKYTYFGDVDLDGQVTPGDYGVLDANLGTTPPPGIAILSGDADFDGSVTPGDYGILDANLGAGSGAPLLPILPLRRWLL